MNPVPELHQRVHARKARMGDISELARLINSFAAKAIMLPRTEFELAENIRDFSVVCDGDRFIACGALHFYSAKAAEIRSLAVAADYQKHGIGAVLMNALEVEASQFQLHALFAFTYVPGFFRKMGYREVDRGELPLKAWKDCLRCPKFQACDEIAMLKPLTSDYQPATTPKKVETLLPISAQLNIVR